MVKTKTYDFSIVDDMNKDDDDALKKTFSLEDFNTYVTAKMNKVAETINRISEDEIAALEDEYNRDFKPTPKDPSIADYLQSAYNIIANIQMEINVFTNTLLFMDTSITEEYYDTISNPSKLGEFVKGMLDAGLASKHIAMNSYLVCSKELKGSNINEKNPVFGQSRAVLFPENGKNILKVALSKSMGATGNKREVEVSNILVKNGMGRYIAKTLEEYSDYSVIRAEFINGKFPTPEDTKEFEDIFHSNLERKGLDEQVRVYDIHNRNVLQRPDGSIVLIDYGL